MVTPAETKPNGFRNRPREHFTQLRNTMLRDPRLSLKAKGLLALMLSFPDDWTYYMTHLETLSTEGRDAHRSAAKELIALGYVIRHRTRDEAGRIATTTYEVADYAIRVPDGTSSTDGFSGAGSPPTTNTDETKTEKSKPLSATPTPSPKPRTPPKEEHRAGQVQDLVDIWNANCGVLPSVKTVSPKRTNALLRFKDICGGIGEAMKVLEKATKVVAQDDFWRKNKYGLDNLLAGDKVFQRAESYEAQESPASTFFSVGDLVQFTSVMGRLEMGEVVEVHEKQLAIKQQRDGRVVRAPLGSIKEVL